MLQGIVDSVETSADWKAVAEAAKAAVSVPGMPSPGKAA
jgi:hypothetical protein